MLAPLVLAPIAIGGVATIPGIRAAALGADAWMLFAALFLGPLGIEVLCRGLVQGALYPHFRVGRHGGAWLVSAPNVVATLLSMVLVLALYEPLRWVASGSTALRLSLIAGVSLIAGLAGGVIRERSGSLVPTILLHAIASYGVWAISLS